MSGYLENYGEGDERREKVVKLIVIALLAVLIVTGVSFWLFQNYRQERQVKRFFSLLASRDYTAAYALWGCTAGKPCPDYTLSKFMDDWGPQSVPVAAGSYHITSADSCGSGVIVDVDAAPGNHPKLWVERDSLNLGFSPMEHCPSRTPFKIFLTSTRNRLRRWF